MLKILEDSNDMIRVVFIIADGLPKSEDYNLKTQMKRAIVSVRLNIREGNVYESKQKKHFFTIALGSLNEVHECVEICKVLGYITREQLIDFMKEYWKILNKLKKLINSTNSTATEVENEN